MIYHELIEKQLAIVERLGLMYERALMDLDTLMYTNEEPDKAQSAKSIIPDKEPVIIVDPLVEDEVLPETPKPKKAKAKKEEPKPELDFTTVRNALSEAAKKGIGIRPIIEQFVPEGKAVNASNVPPEKYAELLDALKKEEADA